MQNLNKIIAIPLSKSAHEDQWPEGWKDMEIESKWTASSESFNEIKTYFEDGTEKLGYKIDVRWGGISRRFTDRYYDNSNKALRSDAHSIRHRTRYQSDPRANSDNLEELFDANWRKNWEVVQYKGTPQRLEAVWFRKESGRCRLSDQSNRRLCYPNEKNISAEDIINGNKPDHEAFKALKRDHPDVSNLDVFLNVVDYRYRIVFKDPKTENQLYEMSMDRVIETIPGNPNPVFSYEVELEALPGDSGKLSRDQLIELFQLTSRIQDMFSLTPTTKSKGGIEIPDSSSGNKTTA